MLFLPGLLYSKVDGWRLFSSPQILDGLRRGLGHIGIWIPGQGLQRRNGVGISGFSEQVGNISSDPCIRV